MSKAILVIDMPGNCKDCPCSYFTEGCYWDMCNAMYDKELEKDCDKQKPDWCPLREVPQKKKENTNTTAYDKAVQIGYNTCIDEILKGGAEQ